MARAAVPFRVQQKVSFGGRRTLWGFGPRIYPDNPEAVFPVSQNMQVLCGVAQSGRIRQVDSRAFELEIESTPEPVGGRAALKFCVPSPPELECEPRRVTLGEDGVFRATIELMTAEVHYNPSEWHSALWIGFEVTPPPIEFDFNHRARRWEARRNGQLISHRASADLANPPQEWEYVILRTWDPGRVGPEQNTYCRQCGWVRERGHNLSTHRSGKRYCPVCGIELPHNRQRLRVA